MLCPVTGSNLSNSNLIYLQENPEIAAKAEKELLEEESDGIRGNYHVYQQLRMRRKEEYLDDEDLYGSDLSDTEVKFQFC